MPPILKIRLEKHLQCEKLLGLARGTTKKRENKKSDESITPIRYNVNHAHVLVVFLYFPSQYATQFYWWSDDQSLYIYPFWNVRAYNHDDL